MFQSAAQRFMTRATSAVLFTILGASLAGAGNGGTADPASLLVFPEFNSRPGKVTVLTVTNTDQDIASSDISVRFDYFGRYGPHGEDLVCDAIHFTHLMTPGDTLTLLTFPHNPYRHQGYVTAHAVDGMENRLQHDHLIGSALVINAITGSQYSTNPFSFRAGRAGAADVDGDGQLDLDGLEYTYAPRDLLVPRFFGHSEDFESDLVMIALTGSPNAQTWLDLLIFNDNEELFTAEYMFRCWERAPLSAVSPLTTQGFLSSTTHDPSELLGAPETETGWLRLNGDHAYDPDGTSYDEPAVLALLVERVSGHGAASLPFSRGRAGNAAIRP